MGASVHNSLYEQALDQLEQIIDQDPDFEQQDEQDFVEEISESSLGGFTTSQVNRINRIFKKYVKGEAEPDDEQDTEL